MTMFDSFKDLGVLRSIGGYEGQCHAAFVKASRTTGAIRRLFQTNSRQLLWPAFKRCVLPALMYYPQAWNPLLVKDIGEVEHVQRRFTKCICGMYELSYEERLHELRALSLSHQRLYSDMIFIYRVLHELLNCTAHDIGLEVQQSCTREGGFKLV